MSTTNTDILALVQAINSTAARARRAAEARLRARNLTFAQYSALAALSKQDGLSQAELAQALETDSTTAMVLRGSLEKKHLVDRKDDPADARIKRIVLTAAGKNLTAQVKPEILSLFGEGKGLFNEADYRKFGALVEKFREFAASLLPEPEEPEGGRRKPGRPKKEGAEKGAAKRSPAKAAKKPAAKAPAAKKPAAKKAAKPAKKPAAKKASK